MNNSLTIIADSNITHIADYCNSQSLGVDIDLITLTGREITAQIIEQLQPHALLVRSVTQVNQQLLANNNSIKFIGSATIGTDHIDQNYLHSRGISFAHASGCSKHSVAQYVITAILALQPNFAKQKKVLGIIGLGNIGQCLARYAHNLGWEVIGYDPFVPIVQREQIKQVAFDQLLQQADIISLHVPLTTSQQSPYPTYHLINKQSLAMIKTDAMLINSSRGKVIQESALLADISKNNRQVVLDVFEYEPTIKVQLLDNLAIATPHIAGYTLEGKLRGTDMIYKQLCKYFNLSINRQLDEFLPINPYHWQELLADVNKDTLTEFYPIINDDQQLRAVANNGQVSGADFDNLRKHYPLRREWQAHE